MSDITPSMPLRRISASPPTYAPALLWLCFVGLASFGVFLAHRAGLLVPVIASDVTGIALLICALLVLGSLHAGYRLLRLSREFARLDAIQLALDEPSSTSLEARLREHDGLAAAFYAAVVDHAQSASRGRSPAVSGGNGELAALLGEQARRHHDAGWFLAGLLVKLGLLGTVVGFVMMLRSVDAIESFDVSDVQRLLTLMSGGMGVALYTTLVGLVSSILLGFQYLCADQAANRFVAVAAESALRFPPMRAGALPERIA